MKYSKKSSSALIRVGLSISAAVGVAACGQIPSLSSSTTSAPKQGVVEPSVAKSYTSLGQLRHDATSVALLRATGKRTTTNIGGITYTISKVAVLKTISGSSLPLTIALRQLGTVGNSQGPPVISTTGVYIAYIQQFRNISGAIAGQYVVIGGTQGLFYDSKGSTGTSPSSTSFVRVNPDATRLPAAISLTQAAQI